MTKTSLILLSKIDINLEIGMAVTDTIGDYLTRIRNAQAAGHRMVEIPASGVKKG